VTRAYGATEWRALRGVELPLAKASILVGINQTILMCLSMVAIVSLIGAQSPGSVVLQSLQYAAKGLGLLAVLAILLCAMVIDGSYRAVFTARNSGVKWPLSVATHFQQKPLTLPFAICINHK
jgi:glycine betaine/proline transport system permease protein